MAFKPKQMTSATTVKEILLSGKVIKWNQNSGAQIEVLDRPSDSDFERGYKIYSKTIGGDDGEVMDCTRDIMEAAIRSLIMNGYIVHKAYITDEPSLPADIKINWLEGEEE